MTRQFHVGRITFGPKHEEERQLLDTSGPLLVAPKGMPVEVWSKDALDRMERAVDAAGEELKDLRSTRQRLTQLLLLAEAALEPGARDTLVSFVRARIRQELRP